ncbi:tetratricopeptide repeat protein [Agrobacterium tumefaciens]|uniref:tetratricopeptide repeat protein n=2 Tax=Agrobacterium tumefaciens TaxID=358 RepID=UPI003B9F0BD0
MTSRNLVSSESYDRIRQNILMGLVSVERSIKLSIAIVFSMILMLSISIGMMKSAADTFPFILRYLSVASMVAVAAASLGGVLGFLFGIPRLLQKYAASGDDGALEAGAKRETDPFFMTNTSLEEVSDWLTKIIIGIGLVQFNNIIEYLHTSSVYVAVFIENKGFNFPDKEKIAVESGVSSSFIFSIIVSCLILSCLFVYLETRTRLTLMFLGMEAVNNDASIFETALSRPLAVEDKKPVSQTDLAPTTLVRLDANDKILVDMARSKLQSPTEIAGWAAAQLRAGRNHAGEMALIDARNNDPFNVEILLRLAELKRYKGDQEGFVDDILDALRLEPRRKDVMTLARAALLEALYLPPPAGFEKAITIANSLESAPEHKQPLIQLRRAAAFGQKFKYLKNNTLPEAIAARESALASVRKVVKLVRNPEDPVRKLLLKIYDISQGGNPRDDDLSVFYDDPEFKKLIVDNDLGE